MKRKFSVLTALLLVVAMLFATAITVTAATPDEMGFVPICAVFEEAGYDVTWDRATRSIQISNDGEELVLIPIIVYEGRAYISFDDLLTAINALEALAAPARDHPVETPEGGTVTGALHRIEYGDNVVYLFGSFHAGREGLFPLAYIVESAMRRSDVFGFETDIEDELAFIEVLEQIIFLPDGLSIYDLLDAEEVEVYRDALRTFGIKDVLWRYVKYENPVFILIQLELMLMEEMTEEVKMGIGESVDAYVLSFANARGLPVIFLESVEQQLRILYMPPVEIIAYVARYFPTLEISLSAYEADLDLDTLADLYEANDFNAINALFADLLISAEYDVFIAYQVEMLYNYRSTYYANAIARLLRETDEPTTFFITVGLSHIIRSDSGEGFTDIVEQLSLIGIEAVPLY